MKTKLLDQIFPNTHNSIFLHAHCDDESFLSAGILNELSKIGYRCTVVYGAASAVNGEEKTNIRQQHARESCSLLGTESVVFLKYCDAVYVNKGKYPLINQNIEDVGGNLWKTLLENDIDPPFSIVSYNRNGGYGNKDHKSIHLLGQNLQKAHPDMIILSEITINRTRINLWLNNAKERLEVNLLPQLSYWSKEFGLPEEEIDYSYKLSDDQLNLKRQALACHKFYNLPDLFPLALEQSDFEQVFGLEFLHIPSL